MELILLGTGHAMVIRCYNTCFAIRDGKEFFLVDAGGGNGIFNRLEKAGIQIWNTGKKNILLRLCLFFRVMYLYRMIWNG